MSMQTIARLTKERSFTIVFSLLISLGLLLPAWAGAVDRPMSWMRTYKHGGSMDRANATAVDTHGNVLVGGHTYNRRPSKTPSGAFLRKYNSAGRLLWKRSPGTAAWTITSIAVAKNDFIYVVGSRNDSLDGYGFIRKYGKNGGMIWTRNFGANPLGIAVYRNRIYVVGKTNRTLPNQTSRGGSDAFVRKYGARGHHYWTRQWGTAGLDTAESVAVDKRGYVYVVGGTAKDLSSDHFNNYLRKYNPNGSPRWTRLFGTSAQGDTNVSPDVSIDSKRDVVVTGSAQMVDPYLRSFGINIKGIARKYTPGGKLKWHNSAILNYGHASAIDSRNNIYMVGFSAISPDDRAFVGKYSRTGKRRWRDRMILGGVANDVAIGADDTLYAVGNTPEGNWFLAKY